MEQEQNNTGKNTEGGLQPETDSIIERADNLAKRLEEANKRTEELLKRQEQQYARAAFSGRGLVTQEVKIDPEKAEKDKINSWLKPFGRQI